MRISASVKSEVRDAAEEEPQEDDGQAEDVGVGHVALRGPCRAQVPTSMVTAPAHDPDNGSLTELITVPSPEDPVNVIVEAPSSTNLISQGSVHTKSKRLAVAP
jgi:hypothetical protein